MRKRLLLLLLCGLPASTLASTTVIGASNAALCYNESQLRFGTDLHYCDLALSQDAMPLSDQAATYSNRGIIHIRRGDFDKALADQNRALEIRPDLAQALVNRGNVYYHQQQYPLAEQDYLRALELADAPEYLTYYNYGLTLIKLRREDEATAMLQQALDLAPESSSIRKRLLELTSP